MLKFLAAVMMFCVLLAGCAGTAQPAGSPAAAPAAAGSSDAAAPAAAPAAAEPLTVRLAAVPTSGQVFEFIADKYGFDEEEGVEVEITYIAATADAVSALTAGQVDMISTYGTGGPLTHISNGADFTIFGGYMIIGETPLYGKPETEYVDLDSLRGKRIGLMRGGTPDIVIKGILYDAGYSFKHGENVIGDPNDPDMIEFIEYKNNNMTLQALANDEIDFGATGTGFQLQAQALGLEVKMWPDELWPNHSCCRMVATTSFVNENEEAIYRLLRAFLRAEEHIQGNMQEVSDLVVENLDVDKPTADSFVLSPHMKYDTDPYTNSVRTMWDKMGNFGYLTTGGTNLDEHMNSAVYKRALDSLIADYPDSQFFKDKLAQFEANNS